MAKSNKYTFWQGDSSYGKGGQETVLALQAKCKQNYINKYYNIWMSKFKWTGLDESIAAQQENFIMRKFWSEGTVASFPITSTDLMGFTTYATNTFNMYDFPETVTLINLRGVSARIIPPDTQVVGRDVAIGWAQPNHKPIMAVVNYYVDKMVSVDMVINTNLQLQKVPFLVAVTEADKDKMEDIVTRILNNEVVVYCDLEELQKVQTLATESPYIIDKLEEYKRGLEQELMTFLGVDNNGSISLEQTHISVDAVNANNDVINDYGNAIEEEIKKWIDSTNRLFNRQIAIKSVSKPVNTVHEEVEE